MTTRTITENNRDTDFTGATYRPGSGFTSGTTAAGAVLAAVVDAAVCCCCCCCCRFSFRTGIVKDDQIMFCGDEADLCTVDFCTVAHRSPCN